MESANIIICCDQVWLSWKKGRKENVWRETKMFCQMCCLLGGEVLRISEDLGQRSPGAIGCTCDVAISQLGVNVRGVAAPPCSVGCASPGSQHHQSAFCVSRLSENLSWVCLRFFSFGQFPHIFSPPPPPPSPPLPSSDFPLHLCFLAPVLFSIYHFDSVSGWPCVLFPPATF